MRVLHIVKTTDGARWAALQAQVLTRLGIQVHVVLPSAAGAALDLWKSSGAMIHVLDCSLPVKQPWLFMSRVRSFRELVDQVRPDFIHSHFVTTTVFMRLALGKNHAIPRFFQVPGPLHLEHALYRNYEVALAGQCDYWIASSQYIRNLYLHHGVPADRVFLSYYGWFVALGTDIESMTTGSMARMREKWGATENSILVGNISYMYPPKHYLGQLKGIKRHEDLIDALGIVVRARPNVLGVLVGGQWGGGLGYETRLRKRAGKVAGSRIVFAGRFDEGFAAGLWYNFDLAAHVPSSENCGGVVEPLFAGVPTIASRVGGLPEVIVEGVTGILVPPGDPIMLAKKIVEVCDNPSAARHQAELGRQLVRKMFDVHRTGAEVAQIYNAVAGSGPVPGIFDSKMFLAEL